MIDTHCHIQTSEYDADREAVLVTAVADGVEAIVVPAIDEASFDATLAICANTAPRTVCAMGVHPHHASEVTAATFKRIEELMNNDNVKAVGEIGLDYHYDFSPRETQQEIFREQVRIAKRAHKPVIVHNRESDEDVLRIIGEEQDGTLRGVLHCFSSSVNMLQRAMALGLHVSFTGNITFKNSTLGDVVREAPLERVMLETDSPWMSPPPWRGKRNEPGRVRMVAEKIAEIKGLDVSQVIRQTTMNAKTFFGLTLLIIVLAAGNVFAQDQRPIPPKPPEQIDTTVSAGHDTVAVVVMPDFYRTFGIGFGVGTTTIIPSQGGTGEANLTTENVRITYMPTRSYGLDFRYWHFVDNLYGYVPRPSGLNDYYSCFDLDARFLFNPRNRVVIGGLLGASYMMLDHPADASYNKNITALFLALTININFVFDWGMLQFYGEYRVLGEFSLGNTVAVPALGLMYFFPQGFKF